MTDLDKLIEAVEGGRMFQPESDRWAEFFPVNAVVYGPKIISSFYGSLDAAKALHDALLPNDARKMGYFVTLGFAGCAIIHGGHNDQLPEDIESGENIHKDNPARAWLIAILKAYRSEAQA